MIKTNKEHAIVPPRSISREMEILDRNWRKRRGLVMERGILVKFTPREPLTEERRIDIQNKAIIRRENKE